MLEDTLESRAFMTFGQFDYQGHTLRYEVHGEGDRVLVYLHGLLMDANMNRSIARRLAKRGWRVVLLDLLGHGRSDKPAHATLHRFDRYARQVVALLDHLGLEKAVIGGASLGADVSLLVATAFPERVSALVLEMPVLEWATPVGALIFLPILLTVHFARRPFRWFTRMMARLPRRGTGATDSLLNLLSASPETTAAVLHGILVGPVAPEIELRRRIGVPTLVIGHERDLLHRFTDATNLVEDVPGAKFLHADSIFELRSRPERLMQEIEAFLDSLPGPPAHATTAGSGVGAC